MKHSNEDEIILTEGGAADAKSSKRKGFNKDGTPRKQGSGRKEGGFSFALVKLSDLNKQFANGEIKVVVGRVWAEGVQLPVVACNAAGKLMDKIEGTTPTTSPKAKVEEL